MPALGNALSIPENVPMSIRIIPIPSENENNVTKPIIGLPFFVTNVKRSASAGVKHGDVTVPATAPATNVEMTDPFWVLIFLLLNYCGIRIS